MFSIVKASVSSVELLHQVGQRFLALDLIDDLEELALHSVQFAVGLSCCLGVLFSFVGHAGDEAQKLGRLEVLILHLLVDVITLDLLEELQHLPLLARLTCGR